ncbi:hypothetical protein AVEN_161055-1 [Araneus ventricosus]|uniref:Uncharacterized protein n=1 Tax=Araneus ventricosus TaxID=182803 RepID=A0A4Y2DX52_ARAVE|nr:hypothetical protein AVEN_161055-1 [Araneus ventricosus]
MMDYKLCIPIMWIINSIIFGLLSQVQAFGIYQQGRQEVRLEDIVKEGYDSFQTPPNNGKFSVLQKNYQCKTK